MKANPEKDIEDMQERMDDLRSLLNDFEGLLEDSKLEIMENVLCEWDHTISCINDLTEEIEERES